MQEFVARLTLRTEVELNVVAVENRFFGPSVNVTGLLTGADLIAQLKGKDLGEALLLPDVVTRDDRLMMLDDIDIMQLELELKVPVVVVDSSPWGILEGLEQIADGPVEVVHCQS